MGRRKPRKCRICKKSPVWRGGDVKNPGPYCKRCYHKHVWSGRKVSQRRAKSDRNAEAMESPPIAPSYDWLEIEMAYWDPDVGELVNSDPESTDDEIPF